MKNYDCFSNEELVMKIRAGEEYLVDELYQRTYKLIAHYAKLHVRWIKEYPDLSIDDLVQIGYFAFLKAIQSYNPNKKSDFHSYILFKYKHALYELLGYYRRKGKTYFRPIAESLNEKKVNDEKAAEKIELLIDEHGNDFIYEIERRELSALIVDALNELPKTDRNVIIELYYLQVSGTWLAKKYNTNYDSIRRMERRALDRLGRNTKLREYYYNNLNEEEASGI